MTYPILAPLPGGYYDDGGAPTIEDDLLFLLCGDCSVVDSFLRSQVVVVVVVVKDIDP